MICIVKFITVLSEKRSSKISLTTLFKLYPKKSIVMK